MIHMEIKKEKPFLVSWKFNLAHDINYDIILQQISDKPLMDLIRVKSRLAQPYAGAFLKKEDRYMYALHLAKNWYRTLKYKYRVKYM